MQVPVEHDDGMTLIPSFEQDAAHAVLQQTPFAHVFDAHWLSLLHAPPFATFVQAPPLHE